MQIIFKYDEFCFCVLTLMCILVICALNYHCDSYGNYNYFQLYIFLKTRGIADILPF